MLRILAFALVLGAPSLAMAQQFPDSPLGQEVRGHDGAVIGRIASVQRDAEGRIVAVEIPGLEPDDAPASALVARNTRDGLVRAGDNATPAQRARERAAAANVEIRIR